MQSSPLDVASFFGSTDVVQLFLDRGGSLDNISVFGRGGLDAAINGGQLEVCVQIVKHSRQVWCPLLIFYQAMPAILT